MHDAVRAKIAEETGYQAIYISGFCVAVSFGYSDAGMISMTELVDRAASVAAATERPVICDARTRTSETRSTSCARCMSSNAPLYGAPRNAGWAILAVIRFDVSNFSVVFAQVVNLAPFCLINVSEG